MIRVILPFHLRNLAHLEGEVLLDLNPPVTIGAILDAIEQRHPMLRGTLRDFASGQRRPFIRFFACKEDLSHDPVDTRVPQAVSDGQEPFLIVGAMAGG